MEVMMRDRNSLTLYNSGRSNYEKEVNTELCTVGARRGII
jgi:hypothetical protein